MNRQEIIAKLRATPSQDIPFTGMVLGGVKKGAAYTAAEAGVLGVDTFWVGGGRAASIDIARRLGIEDAVAAKANQQFEAPPLAVAAPTIQSAAPKPAPAQSRKTTPKAAANPPTRKAAASRQSQSEAVS